MVALPSTLEGVWGRPEPTPTPLPPPHPRCSRTTQGSSEREWRFVQGESDPGSQKVQTRRLEKEEEGVCALAEAL